MPTVLVDTALGRDFAHIDMDMPGVVEHMRSSGVADQDIVATTIRLTDTMPPGVWGIEDALGWYASGKKYGLTNCAWLLVKPFDMYHTDDIAESLDESTSLVLTEHLKHELQHRVFDTPGNKPSEIKRHNAITKAKLGALVLTPVLSTAAAINTIDNVYIQSAMYAGGVIGSMLATFWGGKRVAATQYRKSPEERACNEAMYASESNLITTIIKDGSLYDEPQYP